MDESSKRLPLEEAVGRLTSNAARRAGRRTYRNFTVAPETLATPARQLEITVPPPSSEPAEQRDE